MYAKAFPRDPFMLKCSLKRYKTPEMCDKAFNYFQSTLKFVPDWFVTNKMIKKVVMFYSQMMINFFFDEDSGNVTI